ncbi:uncharacterized protein LOC144352405, partial [Saccoglossus kowalevskii]
LQEQSGARINFNDETGLKEDEERVIVIRGQDENAQKAERLIREFISNQPEIHNVEIMVPQRALGRIIGRNGENIRTMCRISKTRIKVERRNDDNDPNRQQTITIKGSIEQIKHAKCLLEEKVAEEEEFRKKLEVASANRRPRSPKPWKNKSDEDAPPQRSAKKPAVSKYEISDTSLPSYSDYFEVYVSAVDTAGHFWVQVLGKKSQQLDYLVETMTQYYSLQENREMHILSSINIGDIVSVPFPYDNLWYRAKVTNINTEENLVSVYYVDYGDNNLGYAVTQLDRVWHPGLQGNPNTLAELEWESVSHHQKLKPVQALVKSNTKYSGDKKTVNETKHSTPKLNGDDTFKIGAGDSDLSKDVSECVKSGDVSEVLDTVIVKKTQPVLEEAIVAQRDCVLSASTPIKPDNTMLGMPTSASLERQNVDEHGTEINVKKDVSEDSSYIDIVQSGDSASSEKGTTSDLTDSSVNSSTISVKYSDNTETTSLDSSYISDKSEASSYVVIDSYSDSSVLADVSNLDTSNLQSSSTLALSSSNASTTDQSSSKLETSNSEDRSPVSETSASFMSAFSFSSPDSIVSYFDTTATTDETCSGGEDTTVEGGDSTRSAGDSNSSLPPNSDSILNTTDTTETSEPTPDMSTFSGNQESFCYSTPSRETETSQSATGFDISLSTFNSSSCTESKSEHSTTSGSSKPESLKVSSTSGSYSVMGSGDYDTKPAELSPFDTSLPDSVFEGMADGSFTGTSGSRSDEELSTDTTDTDSTDQSPDSSIASQSSEYSGDETHENRNRQLHPMKSKTSLYFHLIFVFWAKKWLNKAD